jgi:hypothetical protein
MIYKMRHCRFELLQQSKSDTYVYLSGSNFWKLIIWINVYKSK